MASSLPVVTPRVVSTAMFAEYLGRSVLAGSSLSDELASTLLVGAEALIEDKISYELTPTVETRRIHLGGESVTRLPGGLSGTEVVSGPDGATLTDYRLLAIRGRPAHLLVLPGQCREWIEVTGQWGFDADACPSSLLNAICAVAARDHFQRLNRQADISQSADGSASSYFPRLPTVATQAIAEFSVPG